MKYNAADEKQIKDTEQKNKNEKDQILNDYKAVLATNEGKRLMKHILSIGRFLMGSMSGNSWTFFYEGARNHSMKIFDEIVEADEKIASELFIGLTRERKEDVK